MKFPLFAAAVVEDGMTSGHVYFCMAARAGRSLLRAPTIV